LVCSEIVFARGHPNIKATHRTTVEITMEDYVTPRGDCIIGVSANKSTSSLNPDFKECLKHEDSILIVVLEVGNLRDFILAQGSPRLILSDPGKIIIRKSEYIEPATLGVRANKAAGDLKRELVESLKNPSTTLRVYLYVFRLDEITSKYTSSRSVFHDDSTL